VSGPANWPSKRGGPSTAGNSRPTSACRGSLAAATSGRRFRLASRRSSTWLAGHLNFHKRRDQLQRWARFTDPSLDLERPAVPAACGHRDGHGDPGNRPKKPEFQNFLQACRNCRRTRCLATPALQPRVQQAQAPWNWHKIAGHTGLPQVGAPSPNRIPPLDQSAPGTGLDPALSVGGDAGRQPETSMSGPAYCLPPVYVGAKQGNRRPPGPRKGAVADRP